jgi:hypothetical protein
MKNINQKNDIALILSSTTSAEINTRLGMLDRLIDGIRIWSQLFYFDGNLSEYYKHSTPNYSIKKILTDGGVILNVKYTVGRKKKVRHSGFIILLQTSQASIYRALSICDSIYWNKAAVRFIETSYPKLIKIYIRQNELKNLLFGFETVVAKKFDVTVKDLTVKERRYSNGKEIQGKLDSERKWTESPLNKAFSEAQERGQWFNSLRISLSRKDHKQSEAFFRVTNMDWFLRTVFTIYH